MCSYHTHVYTLYIYRPPTTSLLFLLHCNVDIRVTPTFDYIRLTTLSTHTLATVMRMECVICMVSKHVVKVGPNQLERSGLGAVLGESSVF